MSIWKRIGNICATFGSMVSALIFIVPQLAQGQGEWEMRVCADPHNFPASSQEQKGFENRIAEIIADELEAELTYVWTVSGQAMVEYSFHPGECDVIMGVAEGAMGLLNTIAYYRTPYVFVYRKDSAFDIQSLDDETLQQLRISTYPNSAPDRVLGSRGLGENVVFYRPVGRTSGPDRDTPIIEAVIKGDVDVGILYGPVAGYFAKHQTDELKVVPVAPEMDPSMLQMFHTWTIGVRPNDEALRDQLNIALAQRWEDIQAVFDEYGVPLLPLPRPVAPQPSETEPIRIGAVLPMRTANPTLTDAIGEAARIGALMAEDLIGREAESLGLSLQVLLVSSPSADAALRAAQRLATTEGVIALIGGFGEDQALVLSEVAEERNVLFFNIASPTDALRGEACHRHTFHVEASAAMYVDGLVGWFTHSGHQRWFFIYEGSDEGRALYQRALEAVMASQAEEVGKAEVAPRQFVYYDELDQVREATPDVVLLLLNPEDQEFFLSQYEFTGLEFPITGFPDPVTQTRDFFIRFQQAAPRAGVGYRAALWETTLEDGGTGDLNERFMSRSGKPMDPSGWAAYAAVKILYEAVIATGTLESLALVEYLESPEAVFDVYKGPGISFRPWDHQLRQPLYLIKLDPEAEWGIQLSRRVELAELIGELPALYLPEGDPIERLDQLGDGPEESNCHF